MLLSLAFLFGTSYSWANEFIEIQIALEEGQFYDLRDLYRQCNEKLGTRISIETIPARKIKLTSAERAGLMLAAETGIVQVSIDADHLILKLPDHQDNQVRLKNRLRLERLFGIRLSEWPEDKGLHLPEHFDPNKRTIVLIHGLGGNKGDRYILTSSWRRLACKHA